jgi:UDP-N-acetylglucosamine 4-epimerase
MTRDIAVKFNEHYGETFLIPEPQIREEVARVPGIDGEKMSKSYGNTVEIFGDGTTSRDFCYIDNVIRANFLAALAPTDGVVGEVFNIAVGDRTSLNDLYTVLRDILAARYPHIKEKSAVHKPFRPGDVMHSLADISKARQRLGYQPTHSLRAGLIEAVAWYIENFR